MEARRLNHSDLSSVFYLSYDDCRYIGAGTIERLLAIPTTEPHGQRDPAGIAIRGGCIYAEVLAKYPTTALEVAAARRYLFHRGARQAVIDALESMVVYNPPVFTPDEQAAMDRGYTINERLAISGRVFGRYPQAISEEHAIKIDLMNFGRTLVAV